MSPSGPRSPQGTLSKVGSIKLRRTGCFGECPTYQVTLRRSGSATWSGAQFVSRIGVFDGPFDPEEFVLLADFVERCGFFDWKDDYRPEYEITDGPTAVIVATRGRLRKTVQQYETEEPPDFWVLATLIDALAEKVAWKPSAE